MILGILWPFSKKYDAIVMRICIVVNTYLHRYNLRKQLKMKTFLVLSPGGFINKHGIEITLKSFSCLYNSVTPKHQRRLRLCIIEEEGKFLELRKLIISADLEKVVNIINRAEVEDVITAYQNAALFLYPAMEYGLKLIPEALSFGLPILTFEHPDLNVILDNTCSMLVKNDHSFGYEKFTTILEMLYFDPEVRKVLSRGAKVKYRNELKWGMNENRMAS